MTRVRQAWERFWFAEQSLGPLVLVRIAFGLLAFLWSVSLLPDAKDFFGPHGVLPVRPHSAGAWSVLDLWKSDVAPVALVGLLGVAALCLAAGVAVRLTSVVVAVAFISLGNRNGFIGNSGDALLRILSLYMVFAAFAIRPGAERGPVWPLRLIQVQVSLIYLATVWAKLRGVTWPDGTAVAYAWRLDDLVRFPSPDIGASLALTHVITWAVLVIEFSIGVLVWNRKLRPWVLLAGVCLHLGIEYRLRVGFFSWAILVTYLSFVPPAAAATVLGRTRWLRSRS